MSKHSHLSFLATIALIACAEPTSPENHAGRAAVNAQTYYEGDSVVIVYHNDFGLSNTQYRYDASSSTVTFIETTPQFRVVTDYLSDAESMAVSQFMSAFSGAVEHQSTALLLQQPCFQTEWGCQGYEPMRGDIGLNPQAEKTSLAGGITSMSSGSPYICGPIYFAARQKAQLVSEMSQRIRSALANGGDLSAVLSSERDAAAQAYYEIGLELAQWTANGCQGLVQVGTWRSVPRPKTPTATLVTRTFQLGGTCWVVGPGGLQQKNPCESTISYWTVAGDPWTPVSLQQ